MAVRIGASFRLMAAGTILPLCACSAPGAQTTLAGGGATESGMAVCDAAMIDTSTNPPSRYPSPATKWVASPDTRAVAQTLAAAAPDRSHPILEACGVVRFSVAPDGMVRDPMVLAEYPQGVGLDDAWRKYMVPVVYPQSAAGGPYAVNITIKAGRVLKRVP